jgi:hypothetical protein
LKFFKGEVFGKFKDSRRFAKRGRFLHVSVLS